MKKLFCVWTLCFFCFIGYSEEEFDILGIKLGMPIQEAEKILSRHKFSIKYNEDHVLSKHNEDRMSEYNFAEYNLIENDKTIEQIELFVTESNDKVFIVSSIQVTTRCYMADATNQITCLEEIYKQQYNLKRTEFTEKQETIAKRHTYTYPDKLKLEGDKLLLDFKSIKSDYYYKPIARHLLTIKNIDLTELVEKNNKIRLEREKMAEKLWEEMRPILFPKK